MRKIIAILLIAACAFACRYQTPENEIKEHLKRKMTDLLYQGKNNDSSITKYNILDVTYFSNPDNYFCKFKVHMHENNLDTTGIMTARISRDFSKINRWF